ncbi:hypothetical protein A1O7_03910 [Cladophialophora yegresii CBS 114405]|uniref:Zn(2)-C6 fungal-type domain-containing protein n=1 Tax=Cladophialophora yegresii CBS 114405 TaxID=1182544 RepID=W9VVR9_9EURO|nr:uncharacterized protein A1O7_03910 [Cladophialophora yegresii CBS 114405]EXJ59763.1 hypothetical protein A1O7_03910 [Cladophialophora yegresii CBS 114405]
MPPRLAHKKSRKGCRRCKERKVKCSEEWPSCAACARHGVHCEYAEDPRSSTAPESHASSHAASRGSSESSDNKSSTLGIDAPYPHSVLTDSSFSEPNRHAIELYLVHRFKTCVAGAFPSYESAELRDIWVWTSVDMGFDFPYLLDAIFAITALYIWVTSSAPQTETESVPLPRSLRGVDYAQLHRMYLNRSICLQRDALANLTSENADAVGLTAVLLSTMATCLLSDNDDADAGESSYTPPIPWLTMHASIAAVFRNAVPFLQPDGPMVRYAKVTAQPTFSNDLALSDPENLAPFQKLLEFQSSEDSSDCSGERSDPSVQDAYVKAVAFLGSICKALQVAEQRYRICMRVVAFGHTIPRTFIRLLAERRPRALAILANYMAFVKYIEKYWWFRNRAQIEISGIRSILPRQWHWALVWPLAVLQEPEKVLLNPRGFQDLDVQQEQ